MLHMPLLVLVISQSTPAPPTFGKPLLNNVLIFDHVQPQKGAHGRVDRVLCHCFPLATLYRCYGSADVQVAVCRSEWLTTKGYDRKTVF